jgi:hypothetical protein
MIGEVKVDYVPDDATLVTTEVDGPFDWEQQKEYLRSRMEGGHLHRRVVVERRRGAEVVERWLFELLDGSDSSVRAWLGIDCDPLPDPMDELKYRAERDL